MKAKCSTYPIDLNRTSLGQYQKSCRQNSNFFNNQQLYTPQHTNLDCNQVICSTKQTIRNKQEIGCANKLCRQHRNVNKQQVVQISMQTLCNECKQQFKNDAFCIYCKQIYFDNTDDGKEWIMCEQCQRWVHSQCADFNTRENSDAVFKCIKCKKIQNQHNVRRNIPRAGYAKLQKKKNNQFLSSVGFQWQLTANQIGQDMENIRQHLSLN